MTMKRLFQLPVQTQSGQDLGRVVDAEIHAETHQIMKYDVASPSLLRGLLPSQPLMIDYRQVIQITEEKMVVEDSVQPAEGAKDAVLENI
ncbi:MAG: PRC-barrel domain-containing protein [Patescibacteria group bacterium]